LRRAMFFLTRQTAKPPQPEDERLPARKQPRLCCVVRQEKSMKVADFLDKIVRQNEESETVSDST
jgi:hypothetical protein